MLLLRSKGLFLGPLLGRSPSAGEGFKLSLPYTATLNFPIPCKAPVQTQLLFFNLAEPGTGSITAAPRGRQGEKREERRCCRQGLWPRQACWMRLDEGPCCWGARGTAREGVSGRWRGVCSLGTRSFFFSCGLCRVDTTHRVPFPSPVHHGHL